MPAGFSRRRVGRVSEPPCKRRPSALCRSGRESCSVRGRSRRRGRAALAPIATASEFAGKRGTWRRPRRVPPPVASLPSSGDRPRPLPREEAACSWRGVSRSRRRQQWEWPWKTEVRGQRTEVRGQRTEDRGQRTEDRGQRTEEDRRQKTEDRRRQTNTDNRTRQ